jgi:hypothetical protein
MSDLNERTADLILGLQVVVAWAGEGLSDPARLGWWETDLVDELGGGDFFERLTPETAQWTSLEAVREAARRVDEARRKDAAEPESIRSLYHLGHEVDSLLEDRWADLRRDNEDPAEVLEFVSKTRGEFDRDELADWCESMADVNFRDMPAGRELRGDAPDEPETLARELVAGLVPFPDDYPMPHYTV